MSLGTINGLSTGRFDEMVDPLVTVCIPTYNRASLLRQSIASVLSQTFHDFRLIVVDNASDDETETVVRSFDDARVKYVRNAQNIGLRGNWNRCLALATGQYITILPDDDLMMPNNLEAKVAILKCHAQVGLVHSKFHTIDSAGNILRHNTNWGHGPDRESDAVECGQNVLSEMVLTYNRINTPTVVFRRACYEKLQGFTDRLSLTQDWEYWMRIAVYYDVAFLASPLIKWRIHGGSQTSLYAHSEGHAPNDLGFREHLAAKRLILRNPLHADLLAHELKSQAWEVIRAEVIQRAETMWHHGKTNSQIRKFILGTVLVIPELIWHRNIWKILTRSIVGTEVVRCIKRFFRESSR